MKIKTKTKTNKKFTITMNKKELQAVQLAVALMWENEHTHENWVKKLTPIHEEMTETLRLHVDPDYSL